MLSKPLVVTGQWVVSGNDMCHLQIELFSAEAFRGGVGSP